MPELSYNFGSVFIVFTSAVTPDVFKFLKFNGHMAKQKINKLSALNLFDFVTFISGCYK